MKTASPYITRIATFFRRKSSLVIITVSAIMLVGFGVYTKREILIFLPGTKPGEVDPADNVLICRSCHNSSSSTRPVTIYKDWSGSMMAQAARDPIFYAALAVANKYTSVSGNVAGEYCIRCHSPSGWLAGHSEDGTGQSLTGTDFDGIQCDYCHRSVDPLNPDSTVPFMSFPVPGYGNGMHVVQKFSSPKRGPYLYDSSNTHPPHDAKFDSFQGKSELCAVCHDVSNVFYAQDRINQAPYQYAPIERTYSEWLMSWYATQGDAGTCQSCHMKDTTGYACVYLAFPLHQDLAKHDLTGGNTFVPDILPDFYNTLDTATLAFGKQRATATLQRAAYLKIDSYHSGDSVIARVRITNLTGHKLPTGYPDGRRMWINLIGKNAQGDTVYQSGVYNPDSAILIRDNHIKVYEIIRGLTKTLADSFGVSAGASFHFILNDTLLFDNRIPPRGFTNLGFQQRLAEPVGVTYADSQYWDITQYTLPQTTSEVTATLYYQTISKEYTEFLRDQNTGNAYDWNQWGDKLYASWQTHGKSQPVAMNTQTIPVSDTVTSVDGYVPKPLPSQTELMQNYPNPFNPSTKVSFVISQLSFVRLKVYDVLGREIATLVDENKQPGTYHVEFNAGNIPSGVYLYTLTVNGKIQTKKMLLLR